MATHFSFPSIEQFRHVVKTVEARSKFHELKIKPVITFSGTIKLHGTNAAVVLDTQTGEMWAQSRERILSLEQDNAGFCQWFEVHKEHLKMLLECFSFKDSTHVAIYGEWCGGNIQAGVAITGLEKMFVAFKIRVIFPDRELWFNPHEDDYSNVNSIMEAIHKLIPSFYTIFQFPTHIIDIEFNKPEVVQNQLIAITESVEAECPVGKAFGRSGIGEGVVWSAVASNIEGFHLGGLMFKVKGEKHSSSKVKTLAAVDVELIKKMNELVEYIATENRLNQGLEVLKTNGIDIDNPKSTKEFIDWVRRDVIKEETDTILASGLDFGKVITKVCSKAGYFFNNR